MALDENSFSLCRQKVLKYLKWHVFDGCCHNTQPFHTEDWLLLEIGKCHSPKNWDPSLSRIHRPFLHLLPAKALPGHNRLHQCQREKVTAQRESQCSSGYWQQPALLTEVKWHLLERIPLTPPGLGWVLIQKNGAMFIKPPQHCN